MPPMPGIFRSVRTRSAAVVSSCSSASSALPAPRTRYCFFSRSVTKALRYLVSQTADAQEFLVLDLDGKVVASTVPNHEGRNQANEGWFQKGSSGTYVQPVATSSLTGKPTITVATPLFDRSGQRIGIVAANLNLERLDRIVLPATGLGKTGASYLVGKNGHFVH